MTNQNTHVPYDVLYTQIAQSPHENINDISAFLKEVRQTIESRADRISEQELDHAWAELDCADNIINTCQHPRLQELDTITPYEFGASVSTKFGPYYSEARQALLRIHEVAGVGTLSSCLTTLPIAESLCRLGVGSSQTPWDRASISKQDVIVGRGHVAPAFYALRHLKSGMPLCYLLAVHGPVPAVVNKQWGFMNTMRHSLGEGLPMAVGRALLLPDSDVQVCLVGDGELGEGISMEALRIAHAHDVTKLVVIIDDNGTGIEPQPKPLNMDYLQSVFQRVEELDGPSSDVVSDALKRAMHFGQRTAIVCKTVKGPHSYKALRTRSRATLPNDDQNSKLTSTCRQVARVLHRVRDTAHQMHIITADLAVRFGLKNREEYLNVGLSEAASVGLTMALPDSDIKVVLTDDKYLYNSMDVMQSALDGSKNLFLIVARKNATWGGHVSAPGTFGAQMRHPLFELVDPIDLERVISECSAADQNAVILMNDQPGASVHEIDGTYVSRGSPLGDTPWIYFRPACRMHTNIAQSLPKMSNTLVISGESISVAVSAMQKRIGFDHLRVLQRRPPVTPDLEGLLSRYQHIAVAEYADPYGALGEVLSAAVGRCLQVFGIKGYENARSNTRAEKVISELETWAINKQCQQHTAIYPLPDKINKAGETL